MEMHEAMRKCEPGGYVVRKAYPGRKYYKDGKRIIRERSKDRLHRFYCQGLGALLSR